MKLKDIQFPVYAIGKNKRKIWAELNVVYIETDNGVYILDNKNLEGNTLGKRRIKIKSDNKYILRKVYYNIEQFLHSKYSTFIDNKGKIFNWEKSIFVPLKYHKVKKVIKYENECVIHLKDINFPQKLNCRLAYGIQYVGVLHTEEGYILYEYSYKLKKDSRRKI